MSKNTPRTVRNRWKNSEFNTVLVNNDYKNAVDYCIIKHIMLQVKIDKKLGHPPSNFILGVTGDSDYVDLIHILRELGHRITIVGWGKVNPKLSKVVNDCYNLREIDNFV